MRYDDYIIVKNDYLNSVYIPEPGENIFYVAATILCMGDCTGDSVLMIASEGYEYVYKGWQPGLVYTFYCKETEDSKVIYLDPERWDH